MYGYINVAACHLLELIREFDENQYWEAQGFQSCAHWLNFKCGMGFGAAREHLRVAKALAGLPKFREVFADGKGSLLENGPHVYPMGTWSAETPTAKWFAGEEMDIVDVSRCPDSANNLLELSDVSRKRFASF